jgi:hypothetical protein
VRGTFELWWEARQGQLTIATGQAVLTHSWSWTAGETSWIPNSWAWGVILAGAYNLAGLGGIVVFVFLVQCCFFVLAWRVLALLGVGERGLRLGLLILLSLTMSGWASGRAELADYFCIFAFAAICLARRIRRRGRWGQVGTLGVAAAVLSAVWENLHLGGLLSIAIFAAVFLICETVSRHGQRGMGARQILTSVAAIVAGAAIGIFLTPSGFAGVVKSLSTASKSRAEHYAAWEPLFAQAQSYNYEPAVLSLAIGVLALLVSLRRRSWIVAVILIVSMMTTLMVVRSGSDLVILSVLAGAGPAAEGLRSRLGDRSPRLRAALPALSSILAVAWASGALLFAGTYATSSWRLMGIDPADLASVAPGTRIYSTVSASDAIALLRPDLQITIDSRNDLYPVRLFEFARSLRGPAAAQAPAWFAKNHVSAVYLPGSPAQQSRTALSRSLRDAGWLTKPESHGLLLVSSDTRVRVSNRSQRPADAALPSL